MKSEVGYLLLFFSLVNGGKLQHSSDELDIQLDSRASRPRPNAQLQEELSGQPPVTVLEVRREGVGDRIKVTVKYQANEASVDVLWEHAWENIDAPTNTDLGGDVFETSIMLDGYEIAQERHKDDEHFYYHGYALAKVSLYSFRYGSTEVLTLSIRYDEGDYVERDIPSMLLQVQPTDYFFYNEGQDFTFEMKVEPRLFEWEDEHFEITSYLFDTDTGKVVFNDNFDLFEIVNTERSQDFDKNTIKMKTSEYRTSGLLGITALYTANFAPALLEEMKRTKDISLIPSTMTLPFPDGYLGFVDNFGPESNLRSGHLELLCREGVPCLLECQAVGANIISVTMNRLNADGTTEPLDNVSDTAVISPVYIMAKRARVLMDATAGQTQTIQCVAENAEGTVKTMEATWNA